MSDRLPWFRCFPSALLGAIAGMEADEGYTYIAALLRIYETGGPVAENARTLSRRTGIVERKVAAAIDNLVIAGKLTRTDDGRLDSASTHEELSGRANRKIEQSSAGKASAAKRAQSTSKTSELKADEKPQQKQEMASTPVEQAFNHLDLDIEQEKKEDTSLRSVACVPERPRKNPWPENYRDIVWGIFPKQTEKKDGIAQLDRVYRDDRISFATITEGIRLLAAHVDEPKFAPALHRWLRKELWNDRLPPRSTARAPPQQPIRSGFAALLIQSHAHTGKSHEPDRANDYPPHAGSNGPGSFNSRGEVQEPAGGTPGRLPPLLDLRAVGSDRG